MCLLQIVSSVPLKSSVRMVNYVQRIGCAASKGAATSQRLRRDVTPPTSPLRSTIMATLGMLSGESYHFSTFKDIELEQSLRFLERFYSFG